MRGLTEQQRHVLNFVRSYLEQHRYPPALTEIASFLGLSKSTVFTHVSALERKGYLKREAGKPRTITIEESA